MPNYIIPASDPKQLNEEFNQFQCWLNFSVVLYCTTVLTHVLSSVVVRCRLNGKKHQRKRKTATRDKNSRAVALLLGGSSSAARRGHVSRMVR